MSANPCSTRIPRLHPPGTLGEEVNSWDSRSEFDPTVTLCSDHLSALLGWPHSLTFSFVSLRFSLPPSLRLPPTDYPPNYVSKRNEKMYCVLLNASCVCLCSSSCHPLPLCRHCGLSMLQWSEEKGMCFKHHCIYRPFPHVISPVLLAAHTEAPFQQSHLYTSYFTHWIMWRVEVSPVKLQRTLWLLYRFCIRVQVGKLRPLKLPFRQQCCFFFFFCALLKWSHLTTLQWRWRHISL